MVRSPNYFNSNGTNFRSPPVTIAMQARSQEGATAVSHQYRCSACAISYDVPKNAKAECPLCKANKDITLLQSTLRKERDKIENMQHQMDALASQVDHVAAIRDALTVIGQDDLAWLKVAMYRYRDDRSLSLMAVAVADRRGRHIGRDNFALVERGRDNELYKPTSIGGTAILGYLDEMTRELGNKQAMSYLLRAMTQVLPGGQMR